MKILIISNAYVPTVSPRAFRWARIAEQWAGSDHWIDVVTVWKPGLARSENLKGVNVHRIGIPVSELVRDRMTGRGIAVGGDISKDSEKTGGKLRTESRTAKILKWVHSSTWKKVWWPDSSCLWYFPALRKAKRLLVQKQHETIISVSLPFTGHLIGKRLKRLYPNIRWIADMGDPFCFLDKPGQNNLRLYARLNRSIEEKIFRFADAVVVTTGETLMKYAGLFPDFAGKIHVIPPLIGDVEDYGEREPLFPENKKIKLVFTGRLARDNRNPDFLLGLFEKLLKTDLGDLLELHFFGSVHDCRDIFANYREWVGQKIFLHGSVDHDTALRAMEEADVLVNIGNKTPYQLPSKVVEYAKTGKPVLNITNNSRDTSKRFFSGYPLCLSLLQDDGGISSEQVTRAAEFIRSRGSVEVEKIGLFLAPYHIDSVSGSYEALLRE